MIVIKLGWNGVKGSAECVADDRTFTEEGSTQAHALSLLCSKLARTNALIGQPWMTADHAMKGVIGDKINKNRRRSVSELPTFELHGGMMHGRSTS